MRARGKKTGNAATDLLVCFPSRARLSLMPKPICSPARSAEPAKRHHFKASPLFRSEPAGEEVIEPTSPKVTCAGQIKIKKLDGSRKAWKWPKWIESIRSKREIIQFLACLRGLKFDMRCLGSFHRSVAHDSDGYEDDKGEGEENEEEEGKKVGFRDHATSRSIFSKWLMILLENEGKEMVEAGEGREVGDGYCVDCSVPPKNALLLMRCRCAPAKERIEEGEEKKSGDKRNGRVKEEETEMEEKLVRKRCELVGDYKVSTDVAMETWLVGRSDPFSRSRLWKR